MSQQEQSLESDLVRRIFDLDHRIRFCLVRNQNRRSSVGGMRPGVDSLLPDDERLKMEMRGILHRAMEGSVNKYLGRMNTLIVQWENVTIIDFLFTFGDVIISTEPDYPIEIIGRIRQLLNASYGLFSMVSP